MAINDDGRTEWQTEDKATYDEKTMDSSIDVLLSTVNLETYY